MSSSYRDLRIPESHSASEIADGVWWIRLDIGDAHVNCYLLEDVDGWILVDTGIASDQCRESFATILSSEPFSRKSVHRVLVTHHHPDHIGLAGWFAERGCELLCTRTCWLTTGLLLLQSPELDAPAIDFLREHGASPLEIEAFRRRPPNARYQRLVYSAPLSYRRLQDTETLSIGRRKWTVHIGHGHAAEHATLWSNDGLAIVGDQILPGISPSLMIHPSEPNANILDEWLKSCEKFAWLATPDTLCLPGHNDPFFDIPTRCGQLSSAHLNVLTRLHDGLSRPKTTIQCAELVGFDAETMKTREASLFKTVVYLNYLAQSGKIICESIGSQNIWRLAH